MTLEERNRLLGSIPQEQAVPVPKPYVDNRDDMTKILEGIGTGGYEAANSVLMGLPDVIINSMGESDAKKAIEGLRQRNKEAAQVGEIGGLVGSMFIPGGALVKGLGMGAKALGAAKAADKLIKAGKWIEGGQLTGNLAQKALTAGARGAAQSAEQIIPRALLAQADAGKTAEEKQAELANAPLSILTGAGLGDRKSVV